MDMLKAPHTIRTWLTLLVVACISPAAAVSIFLVYNYYLQERENVRQGTIKTARVLMHGIDLELSSAQGTLEALATSPYLAKGDFRAFHDQATQALRYRTNNNIVLTDASGQQLMNTLLKFGTPLPHHGNPEQLHRVFKTGQPVISDLYLGAVTRQPLISIDVPVLNGDRVTYVLSMGFFPANLGDILTQAHLPEDWVVSIFDSTGTIVACTHESKRFVGKKGVPTLIRRITEVPEGSVETNTLEGISVIAVFSRSTVSRWSVAIGIARDAFLKSLVSSIFLVLFGMVFLLAACLLLSKAISNRITSPIRGLVAPAIALGRGGPVMVPDLALTEARDVGQALIKASQLLQERTAERNEAEKFAREIQLIKQQLELSEAFLRGIFEEAPDAILVVTPSGHIERANLAAERIFGFRRNQLLSHTVEDLMPDEVRQRHRQLRSDFFVTPVRRQMGSGLHLLGKRSDGSLFPIDVMLSPLQFGQDRLVIAMIRDVTEGRRNEDALRASEARFRNILENAPIGMAIISLEGRWVEVNSAVCEIVGYEKKELEDLSSQDITYPDDLHADLAFAQRLLNGEIRSYQMEKRYIRKDGRAVPVMLTGSLLRDDKGKPLHFIAQIQDITERKQNEAELNALHHRLSLATEAGGIAVWEWDLATNTLLWDDRMYALYKVPRTTGRSEYDIWERNVHPDDIERVIEEEKKALSGIKNFSTEFRIVWPNGDIRTIRAVAVVSKNDAGMPIRMTGINWDITEHKLKEEAISAALHEKETLLKELYHRVKNNLQVINSLFNLQARTLDEGPARTTLKEGADRVHAMALVHEKFYRSGNLASISLDEYIMDLCEQLGHAAAADQRHISLAVETEPIQVGLDIAVPLGLLLNELISNCLKHAFPNNRSGTITVHLVRIADDMVELVVSDNGIGAPEGMDMSSTHSLGLKLVFALSAQLGGKLSMEIKDGTHVRLIFSPVDSTVRRKDAVMT